MAAITHLYSIVPVRNRAASLEWFEVFFGCAPDEVIGVEGVDEILARLDGHGIGHESLEVYDNGVRHVDIVDPDGNVLSLGRVSRISAS